MRTQSSLLRWLSLAALLLASCSRAVDRPMTPARLRQAFERAPRIEVQVADGPGRGSDHLEAAWCAAEVLAQRTGKEVVVTERVDGRSMDVPRIVIGVRTDPGVEEAIGAFPGDPTGGSAVVIRGEDPARPGQPIAVYSAANWTTLSGALENLAPALDFGASRVSAQKGRVERTARAQLASNTPVVARAARWKQQVGDARVRMRLTRDVDVERARLYHAAALRVLEHVEGWYGAALEGALELQTVGSAEQFRSICGRDGWSGLVDLPNTRLVLLAPGLPGDDAACVARWAAARLLGPTARNWLFDGAALDASNRWWGQDLVAWGRWLAARDLLPSVAQLVDSSSVDRLSQHQLAAARGLFFRYLRGEHESAFLRGLWQGREELTVDDALESAFREWLLQQPVGTPIASRVPRAAGAFDVGVALASDAGVGGGMDLASLRVSLIKAQRSGANSLSVTSYFSEHPTLAGARIPSGRECLEGDVAVAHAVQAARLASLEHVSLQAHLLLTPSAGYSAWQRRTNIAHWRDFFDELDLALVHYGLLAQLSGVDLLCIGTRLSSTKANGNLDLEVKAYHDQRWAAAIGLTRRAFSGALTYAANAHGEAEHFAHWGLLDYVGISSFPRWQSTPEHDKPLRKRLEKTLEALDQLSATAGKPVMILETGARSTQGGLVLGRVGIGDFDLAPQQRFWTALADALGSRRAAGKSLPASLAGIYAWNWDATPGPHGEPDRGFNLRGKPVAKQLSRLHPLD